MERLLSEKIGAHIKQLQNLRAEIDPSKVVDIQHIDTMTKVWEHWQLHALNMESKLAHIRPVPLANQPEIPVGGNVVRLPVRRMARAEA